MKGSWNKGPRDTFHSFCQQPTHVGSAPHEILSQINKYIIFTLEKKTWSVLLQFSASTIDRNKSVLESNLKGNLKPILVI